VTKKLTLKDISDWTGKTAFVRVDFNVPVDKETGEITDDTRIREALPTLEYLLANQAKVIVACHFGRPKGQVVDALRVAPIAKHLETLLPQVNVHYSPDSLENYPASMSTLGNGELALLENIRFAAGEEKNDIAFSKKLATHVDVFVNDAFGAAHRGHASTSGIAEHVPQAVAGLLMAREIEAMTPLLTSPQKPFVAIIGGSKVSTKITVLENLLEPVDHLVIGGAMVFTFLKAQGIQVGNSLVEDDCLDVAKDLMTAAQAKNVQIHLASDIIVADSFSETAKTQTVSAKAMPADWMGLDIGPESTASVVKLIQSAKTVLWNGPLGAFEMEPFATATRAVAETVASVTEQQGAFTVLGGGDTVASIHQFGIEPSRYSHVSTGGGASLEFLEGQTLPGIAAIHDAPVTVGSPS
jgi:phosphoglycerate kinase